MKSKFLLSYLDYFIYLLTCMSALFVFAFVQINDENKKGNVIEKAEFVIEAQWEDGSPNDVDLWVAGPSGNIVYFNHKDSGVIVLDRDDLGINNTVMIENGQAVTNPSRREVATIRKIVPGTYTVNIMMYHNRNGKTERPHVTVRRLNPYQEVTEKTVDLTEDGDQKTIVNFDLSEDGTVTNVNDSFVSLFNQVH